MKVQGNYKNLAFLRLLIRRDIGRIKNVKVSKSWLQELVDLKNTSMEEVERLLPLRSIGTKEITPEFIELDMKGYNRADLLSMRGVAYEVSAITGSKIKFEETKPGFENSGGLSVEVKNPELAPLYCIAKIEGLKVGKSPDEWVKKLEDAGLRPINNIADVTNLVMLEFGQPLHAFDAQTVKDEKIIVRTANHGEKIETLDAKNRELEPTDLLITDPEKNLGIAGVMGGKNSEVTDETRAILLEAAIFDPQTLRKISQRLNLTSEASKRFYHGLTKKKLMQALEAAIKMYEQLGGKVTALEIAGDYSKIDTVITVRKDKVTSLIGIDISAEQIENYLKKLYFQVLPKKDASLESPVWLVSPPYWRLDIEIEEDVVEEVARMYGYEKIPAKELVGEMPEKVDQSLFEMIYQLKTHLAEQGFTEVQTYSFFSTDVIRNFDWKTEDLVKLANPISSEAEYLRSDIWPNLVEVIAKNIKKGYEKIAVFEIGKVYQPQKEGRPEEKYRVALSLMDGSENPLDELVEIINSLYEIAQHHPHPNPLPSRERGSDGAALTFRQESMPEIGFLHPHRHAFIGRDGKVIGGMGEVHKRVTDKFGITKRVASAEIEI